MSTAAGPLPRETWPPPCVDAGRPPEENAAWPPENRVEPESWLEDTLAVEPAPVDCTPCMRTEQPEASSNEASTEATVARPPREARSDEGGEYDVTIRAAMRCERS